MVFHDASPPSIMPLIQAIFKARSMLSKSIIFKPPRFFSAIMGFFLNFGDFVFPNVKCEVLYISLARPSVLTMFILPMRVRFLLFQLSECTPFLRDLAYKQVQGRTRSEHPARKLSLGAI